MYKIPNVQVHVRFLKIHIRSQSMAYIQHYSEDQKEKKSIRHARAEI